MRVHIFQTELLLPLPPGELFPFFADANNLQSITPPWLRFHIVTPKPIVMNVGTLIDYRLRIHGFPMRWRTRINEWQPPRRFVDEQISGPYKMWVHEHDFIETAEGTLMRDTVRYAAPLDWLTHRWLVRPDIEKIFRYREEILRARFISCVSDKPEAK